MISTSTVCHHYLSARSGLRLHAIEFACGAGGDVRSPPLLLLHGVTGHAWLWHDVAQSLSAGRRVIALDMRGHGDSQWSARGEYQTAHHVDDVEDVVHGLGLPARIDVAGLSWGALIAMAYAARHADVVRQLAVIDVEPSFAQSETEVFPRPVWFASVDEVLDWERKANPHAPQPLLVLHAQASVVPGRDGGFIRKHDPYFFARWPFRADDMWALLSSLTLPMLMLHGEHSFVRLEVMQRMASTAANADFREIASSGHLVPLEAPQALAEHLLKFFDG